MIIMPRCNNCGGRITGVGSADKTICVNCELVELPKLVPPVYRDELGNLLYVDVLKIRDHIKYCIFYRNAETNFDADLTRAAISSEAQLDRFSVVMAMRKLIDRAVSAKSAMWKRVE